MVYFNNSLQKWLIAACIAVIAFATLKFVQRMMIRKLSVRAASTYNQIDDLLLDIFKHTKFFAIFVVSIYVASYFINITPTISIVLQKTLGLTIIIQAGLWAGVVIAFWINLTIKRHMSQDISSATTINFLGFAARVVLWAIVLLLVLDNLGINITGLVAGLGIGGIAVALAVQNILGDLLASLSIILDKPFIVGDFIVVDSFSGTIERIGLKTTQIRSLSGEQLIFANNDLLKSRIRNYKRMSERRVVFNFGVVYQTLPEKLTLIKEIVGKIIVNQQKTRLDRVHFDKYGDSALNYEVVYYVLDPDYNIYMDIQEAINLQIFKRFHEEKIDFAFPTQTIYFQRGTK